MIIFFASYEKCCLLLYCFIETFFFFLFKLPVLMASDIFPEVQDDIDDANDQETSNQKMSHDKNNETNTDHAVVSEEGSSVEDPYVTADEGYEADIEVLDCKRNR